MFRLRARISREAECGGVLQGRHHNLATESATSLNAQFGSGGGYEVGAGVENSTEATKMSHPQYFDKGIWNSWPECGS